MVPLIKMKLKVEPIPVPRGYIHPPAPDEILPRHEFTLGLIGKFYSFAVRYM